MAHQAIYINENESEFSSVFIRQTMQPKRIKEIRNKFGLTQVKFAELLNINYDTLRSWEGGYRTPSSPGYALLLIAEKSPQEFIKHRDKVLREIKSKFLKG
jgi:DNA-binding transcriptional regulator YiaG